MGGTSWQRTLSRERTAEAVKAALTNEELTRERVDRLERHVNYLNAVAQELREARPLGNGRFLGRLRWLFTGK